ncbi:MAG: hypothetical protein Q4A37_02165 [Candidatus Saccharibacteria bacterium]|nr:hypothetical protein [Candidatus Saccharibacteria bacterium]
MALTNDDKQWIKGAITDGVVEALETIILPRFDAVEARLDAVEKRLDSVESRLDSVEARLIALEAEMRTVRERLDTLEWQVEALTNDIKELYAAVYKTPNRTLVSESFRRLSDKDKIVIMHEELLKMAKKKQIPLAQ